VEAGRARLNCLSPTAEKASRPPSDLLTEQILLPDFESVLASHQRSLAPLLWGRRFDAMLAVV